MMIAGCASQKNTSQMRFWHSFNAKYNIYYNGSLAYKDGCLEKENGNKDNYTELLPLYTVGNKKSATLGKGNFDRAIEKCEKAIKRHSIKKRPIFTKDRKKTPKEIEWLNRKEYNPFLWKAWLLMGKSQFQKGAFDEAAATFSYMSRLYLTQPNIYGIARAWLARSYTELDWIYDAEDVIHKMERDTIGYKTIRDWDETYADYYIHQGRFKEAIPYLKCVIKHERRRKQRAREWFLMGQILNESGNKRQAFKAYRKVMRQNPSYELEFNARIAQTEVMERGKYKQIISKLKRMAASDNNKDYLDQVYYAIGNIYLSRQDTVHAISEYEKGAKKATRSGIEKGVLLLRLGNLYWDKEKFSDAKRCYGEAIGLLDKDRPDYKELSGRSAVLDELVPHTDAIYLQDSLQTLAKLPVDDRMKAIDRVIDALKKKEKEQKDAANQAALEKQQQQQQSMGNINRPNTNSVNNNDNTNNGLWYFYNTMTVNQGKSTFQKIWGKRQNVDDWQRNNKTVVASTDIANGGTVQDSLAKDSLAQAGTNMKDSVNAGKDSLAKDPHNREYYLAQIPFTDEQIAASNKIIEDGLYNSGVIFKDKLDNLKLSEKALHRLTDHYPDFATMDDVYYHLFLLYSRLDKPEVAQDYITKLKKEFPNSKWTALLSDPDFVENAKFGVHIEDSVYAATYDAFKANRMDEIKTNAKISEKRFPLGTNRPKFIFIDGLRMLNDGNIAGCLENMKEVVDKYPQSEVSEMAGMIVKGVQEGKTLHGGKLDLGSIWERREVMTNDSTKSKTDTLSIERNTNFTFLLAYPEMSLDENQLLYELAKYNFTNFMVRNFDISIDKVNGVCRMQVKGFLNYDEALQYARQLYNDRYMGAKLKGLKRMIISDVNLKLIGSKFSYKDYENFYDKTFAPLKISDEQLLEIPETIEQVKPEKNTDKEDKNKEEEDF
jgi:tetratricopeptide (TPR) repeat protein